MKKLFIIPLVLLSLNAQSSCLSVYKKLHKTPDMKDVREGISTTAVGAISASPEILASLTTTEEVAVSSLLFIASVPETISLLDPNTMLVMGLTSTTTGTQMSINSFRNNSKQIALLEDAYLSPEKIGVTLANFTDGLNDSRHTDNTLIAEEVAQALVDANERGEFCEDENDLYSIHDIKYYLQETL